MGLPTAIFDDLWLFDDRLKSNSLRKITDGGPIAGARAAVETGADLSRFTATRLALLGPFALAFKKKKQETFLMVEGDGWALVREVDRKDGLKARKFAMAVNAAASKAAAAAQ